MQDVVLYDLIIREGERPIAYVCASCKTEKQLPIAYKVEHTLTEHHDPRMEGHATEKVEIKSDYTPKMVECADCGHVSAIKMNRSLFEDFRSPEVNIKKPDMFLKYPVGRLENDIGNAFDSVMIYSVGKPVKA